MSHAGQRVKEAEKLGFRTAILPSSSADLPKQRDVKALEIETLPHLVAEVAGRQIEDDT